MVAQINFPPITQGDTWVKTFQLQDADGNILNLTGCKFHLQFKSNPFNVLYADLSTNNGKISVDTTTGIVTLKMMPEDTAALKMRSMKYDLDLTWPNGQNDTVLSGKTQIILQVTESIVPPYLFMMDLTDIDQVSNFLILAAENSITSEGIPEPEGPVNFDFTDIENSGYFAALVFGKASTAVIGTGPILDFTNIDNSSNILGFVFGTASQAAVPGSPATLDFTLIDNSGLFAAIA